MTAHGRGRVNHGGAQLNVYALHGIGVIAGPVLRRIVEHRRVITSAAAGAALQQNVRESSSQAVKQLIGAQNKAMEGFLSAFGREPAAAHFSQVAVKVPLHILNVGGGENGRHALEEIISHILTGHIQHILVAGDGFLAAFDVQTPVRVGLIQFADRGDHLRLEPETKFQAQSIDLFRQFFHAAADFIFVNEPVAQRALIAVALTEPAVIQHEHFDTAVGSFFGDGEDFFVVKVEVGGFPVVDQYRTGFVTPFTATEVAAVQLVEGAGHFAQTFIGEDEDRFRSDKGFSRFQTPSEVAWIDAGHQTDSAVRVGVSGNFEVAGVNQRQTDGHAMCFGGLFGDESSKWVVVMAGCPTLAGHGNGAVGQRCALYMALSCPCAPKVQQLRLRLNGGEVHAGAISTENVQRQLLFAAVFNDGSAANRGKVAESGIIEFYSQLGSRVLAGDDEGLRFFIGSINSRLFVYLWFAVHNFIGYIAQIGGGGSGKGRAVPVGFHHFYCDC